MTTSAADRAFRASLEASDRAADPLDSHLLAIENLTSHLAEVTGFFVSQSRPTRISGSNLFENMVACAGRVELLAASHEPSTPWRRFWTPFHATLRPLRSWSGDPATTAHIADILFVSSVVIRRLYVSPHPKAPCGVGYSFGLCAASLPVAMELSLGSREQAAVISQNLRWLREHL